MVVSCEGSMAPSRRCFDTFVNPVTKGADLEAQQIYNEVEGNPCQETCIFLIFCWEKGAMKFGYLLLQDDDDQITINYHMTNED